MIAPAVFFWRRTSSLAARSTSSSMSRVVRTPRSLDLVHLRAALWFHARQPLTRFATEDADQLQAARELGLPVACPPVLEHRRRPRLTCGARVENAAGRSTMGTMEEIPMRKIIVGAMVSLDGVMQAPGGPSEDPTGGFRFGGWVMPYFDQEFGEELDRIFGNFDLLLGRKTYEIFAAYWPYYDESGADGEIARRFDAIKKYVVSRSGAVDTGWQGSVLLRDVADVERLKHEDGPDLVTQGSTELVHALLAHDLVDALSVFTVPVVLGSGKKLFAGGSAPQAFELTGSRVSSSGVLVGHYARDGAIRTADTALDSRSERELARQERMQREG